MRDEANCKELEGTDQVGIFRIDRKPFGPFTDVAELLGLVHERTPQGRFVA